MFRSPVSLSAPALLVYTICAQTINLKLSSQLAKLLRLFVWSFLKPDKSVASAEKVGN